MEGDEYLQQFSPEILFLDPRVRNGVSLLPHTVLFHGTADFSIYHQMQGFNPFLHLKDHNGSNHLVESIMSKVKTAILN